jgi:DNA primase
VTILSRYSQSVISPETIQQITGRIDIIDVVGEFVKLKKRGANYLGLCPFHNEKSPSFTVSPAKEIYKCFGCGKSGNTISFLMEAEKYSYVEALKWLANRYGIEVEETYSSPEVRQQQLTADSLFAINNFAQKFFSELLTESDHGHVGLSYLKDVRGFRDETIRKFQLGYNPEARNTFANAATAHQFNGELLVRSGLVVNRNEELVDNYRGRIIFPIHNNTGKIIGFGARIIAKNDKAPKYINTPENEIYIKSKILYGSYFARHAIDKNDECLLVEGYTDVISLHQNGIENVVASGGTSLTTDQLRIIKKYTNNLTIIYDGDAAGIKAALRGLDMALEESLNVKLVLIPDKEDPDSYVNKVGPAAFQKFIAENRKDFILFQLEVMLKEAGNDVARKNEVVNQVAETLSKINKAEDFTKQQDYIRQCSSILRIDESGLTTLVNKYKRDKISADERKLPFEEAQHVPEQPDTDTAYSLFNQDEAQERSVIRVLLEYGLRPWDDQHSNAEYVWHELENFTFDNPELERIYNLYFQQYQQGLKPTAKSMLYIEDQALRELIISITMFPFELSHRWDDVMENMHILDRDTSKQDVLASVNYFKLRKIKKMFDQNQKELEMATDLKEQMKLIEIHKTLKQIEIDLTKQIGSVIIK